jgi:hypothetical protein
MNPISHPPHHAILTGVSECFTPRLDILPKPQRRLWDDLAAVPAEFVLYGGTAIALHLGHRRSVDFDFFGNRAFDPDRLAASVPLLETATIVHQEPNTLTVLVNCRRPVKLSFFGVPRLPRLAPPHIVSGNGLRIAALLDLAGTKASVVQRRAEAKDYVDIDAILLDGRIDLATALAAARALYGPRFNPQVTLKALSFFDDGGLRRLPKALKDRLAKAVGEVDLDQLPVVTPLKRSRQ